MVLLLQCNDGVPKLFFLAKGSSMRLHEKVAIITGAGRGIGRATAIKFATEGAKVVICDLTPEWIKDTIYLCKETRGETMGYVADVRDIKAVEAMVAATVAKWG